MDKMERRQRGDRIESVIKSEVVNQCFVTQMFAKGIGGRRSLGFLYSL